MRSQADTFYLDIVDPGQFYCYKITAKDTYGTEGPSSNEECYKVLVNYTDLMQSFPK